MPCRCVRLTSGLRWRGRCRPSRRWRARRLRQAGGCAAGAADHLESTGWSQTRPALKTGSGRQGHSWVRIPPPPLKEPDSAWLSRLGDSPTASWRRASIRSSPLKSAVFTHGGAAGRKSGPESGATSGRSPAGSRPGLMGLAMTRQHVRDTCPIDPPFGARGANQAMLRERSASEAAWTPDRDPRHLMLFVVPG
jgi:hypothetical protein